MIDEKNKIKILELLDAGFCDELIQEWSQYEKTKIEPPFLKFHGDDKFAEEFMKHLFSSKCSKETYDYFMNIKNIEDFILPIFNDGRKQKNIVSDYAFNWFALCCYYAYNLNDKKILDKILTSVETNNNKIINYGAKILNDEKNYIK